ncbi:hypothetical protein D4764_11G0004340 [Takifugu flavidus]|uniref:Uncharacterized protein n=1 Tax=Takifugu flavidus TaxID=433684 RepID=A0A5C6PFJ3_9TELE|nr:hypothetical protein D4764_11G0004340 [Takifugu flavidus]
MVAMPVMAEAPGVSGLEKLTRRHAVKLSSPTGVSVEECVLAVGEIVGHGSVKSASRMNSAVVVFVDSTEKAIELVVAGVVVNGELTPVFSLSNAVKKRLTRELVEQTATRVAETVLDMEDVGVEENSINMSIKQKNTDTKVEDYFPDLQHFQESTKYFMKTGSFGQVSFTDQELYRLKKLLLKVRSRLESAD